MGGQLDRVDELAAEVAAVKRALGALERAAEPVLRAAEFNRRARLAARDAARAMPRPVPAPLGARRPSGDTPDALRRQRAKWIERDRKARTVGAQAAAYRTMLAEKQTAALARDRRISDDEDEEPPPPDPYA